MFRLERPGSLERDSNTAMSIWIRTHLHVAIVPFPDRDRLADIEEAVLDQLDPPLNLKGVPPTAIRAALGAYRQRLTLG